MFGFSRRGSNRGFAVNATCDIGELRRLEDIEKRSLRLYGEITQTDIVASFSAGVSVCTDLAQSILEYNEEDRGLKVEERQPIWLFIDSPGGDPTAGFKLIDAIRLSKTPVLTVNMGQCSSMAFLIAISGHARFSLPMSTFLMHDGSIFVYGTTNKVKDQVAFELRVEEEKIKPLVLKRSKMSEEDYKKVCMNEFYMMPEDALRLGFIDGIIDDIDVFANEVTVKLVADK